jgi:hypothetical protein
MRVYEPAARTSTETIRRHGQQADRGDAAEAVARAWTAAGFADETTMRWLGARCFDPRAAGALAKLGVTPQQAAVRTRDGGGGYIDTIGFKVANGDLTPRQGAARSLSSR